MSTDNVELKFVANFSYKLISLSKHEEATEMTFKSITSLAASFYKSMIFIEKK